MNDLDTIQAMLKRANIEYTLTVVEGNITRIDIEEGYIGFYSCIAFNEDKSLLSIKAYE